MRRMIWLLMMTGLLAIFTGCAGVYREVRERETESFSIWADSSRANTALNLSGKRASLDEAARAYQEINNSNTQRETLEVEKLRIASEERRFKEWIEAIKKNPQLLQYGGGLYGPGLIGDTGLGGYEGIIGNESDYTLIAKIPAINYTSPSIPPDGFVDHVRLPEGKFEIRYIKAATGKLFAQCVVDINAKQKDQYYKGRTRDWYSFARNR